MGGISAFAYPGSGARRLLIGGGEIMPALQRGIARAHLDFTGEIFVLKDPMTVRNLNAQARDAVSRGAEATARRSGWQDFTTRRPSRPKIGFRKDSTNGYRVTRVGCHVRA